MQDMNEINGFLEYTIKTVRGNPRLTPQARQADLARAYLNARARAEQLRQAELNRVETERRRLDRQAFGYGGSPGKGEDAMSRRDALDRAEQITDAAEALRVLSRANYYEDEVLAKAVARRAAELDQAMAGSPTDQSMTTWRTVVKAYAAERPAVAEALTKLGELPDYHTGKGAMQLAITYGVPRPSELDSLSDSQLEALANSDLAGADS